MNRRQLLAATAATLLARPALATGSVIEVYKSPTCGCCSAWVDHLRAAGFTVDARDVEAETLDTVKRRAGLTAELVSCHTGLAEGYVLEGHIPAEDVTRLLAERPDALGLAVPGMPFGSPGMEVPGRSDTYETLLIGRDGTTTVFARHG